MSEQRKILGDWGEKKARDYLLGKGYSFLEANWRNRYGEIDLIMLDQGIIVFIEVRTKRENGYGLGFESINLKKQKQLIKMANAFLLSSNWWEYSVRFDVISIDKIEGVYKLKHLKNVLN